MTGDDLRLRTGAAAWHEIDGETVLLGLTDSTYYEINPSGSLLWSMLAEGTTRTAMTERLLAEYDISEEQANTDVDAFIRQCTEHGYLDA